MGKNSFVHKRTSGKGDDAEDKVSLSAGAKSDDVGDGSEDKS